ncbi:hypothetical protein JXM83_07300 [Candidatus Woesearchaeota archaeon]|nr:hypothetical protein [Candidatus Woesearchaeota archaeon]
MRYQNGIFRFEGKDVIVNPVIEFTPFENLETLLEKCNKQLGKIFEVNLNANGEQYRPFFENKSYIQLIIELNNSRDSLFVDENVLEKITKYPLKTVGRNVICYTFPSHDVVSDDIKGKSIFAVSFNGRY